MANLNIKPAASGDDLILKDGAGNNIVEIDNANGAIIKNQAGNNILSVSDAGGVIVKDTSGNNLVTVTNSGMDMGDTNLVAPKIKDYSETVQANGTKTAAFDIDLSQGNIHTATIGSGTFNVGITNFNSSSNSSNSFTLVLTDGGAGTLSFVAGAHAGGGNAVQWAGGTAPTLTASGVDILVFFTPDSGTTFYGFAGGLNFS